MVFICQVSQENVYQLLLGAASFLSNTLILLLLSFLVIGIIYCLPPKEDEDLALSHPFHIGVDPNISLIIIIYHSG